MNEITTYHTGIFTSEEILYIYRLYNYNFLKGKCVLVSSGNRNSTCMCIIFPLDTKTHLPFRKFSTSSEVPQYPNDLYNYKVIS